jgi:hypothetical protein
MTTSRLISGIRVQTLINDQIVVNYNGGGATPVTIPAGIYYWSCDGAADDFATVLQTALLAEFGGTWTVAVLGIVIASSAFGVCDGHTYIYEDNNNFVLCMTDADWTLDPRILGYSGSADATAVDGYVVSEWVHRRGWYPQTEPIESIIRIVGNNAVETSSSKYLAGVSWGEFATRQLAFDCLPGALVRVAAAADAVRATDPGVVTGDLNCAWECFATDLACDCGIDWRLYPDVTDPNVYVGPYVFLPGSVLWVDPLALSMVQERAGELWTCAFAGIEAIN